MNLESVATAVSTEYRRMLNRVLRRAIKHLEGEMPPDLEVAQYARREVNPSGTTEWFWKGTLILRETPTSEPNRFGMRIEAPAVFLEDEK